MIDTAEEQLARDAAGWAEALLRESGPEPAAVVVQPAYNALHPPRRSKQREKQRRLTEEAERREAARREIIPAVRERLSNGESQAARELARALSLDAGEPPLLLWCEGPGEVHAALETCLRYSETCYDWDLVGGVLWVRTWYDKSHPY
jgi:hypothetical protein